MKLTVYLFQHLCSILGLVILIYLDYALPFIRRELTAALDENDNLARLILRLYDEYSHSIRNHMQYEEKNVFPYVDSLLKGETNDTYDVETYSKHHGQTDVKLRELKSIIIKYLPSDSHHNNRLTATLYDIYNCEEWLTSMHKLKMRSSYPLFADWNRRVNRMMFL